MLHTETVEEGTFELLKCLMRDSALDDFRLVGETAAALQIGHRVSVDLDLFTNKAFNTEKMRRYLKEKYGFVMLYRDQETLKGTIDGVKIDCIVHQYPWIEKCNESEGIRLASLKDISAMKLNAIINSGERVKDFIDVAYISKYLTLNEMLDSFVEKYDATAVVAYRALGYWDDIDFCEPIIMTRGVFKWNEIAKRLEYIMKYPDKK